MNTMIGVYAISISADRDSVAFEQSMKTLVFPSTNVGQQTRGGIVTSQQLVKSAPPGPDTGYFWIVRWENQGGSPFGSEEAPPDPAGKLVKFEAKTSFTKFELVNEE
jgi:hypothetical protein